MMILTEYLIDVLSRLSCLVAAIAMLTCVVALYSALKESITINPNVIAVKAFSKNKILIVVSDK